MLLQLKILKMKKRLSKDIWLYPSIAIALSSLVFSLVSIMQVVNLPLPYGHVSLNIPLVAVPFADPGISDFDPTPESLLSDKSPAVLLNTRGDFFFGEIKAFSSNLHQSNNKFLISSVGGRPDLTSLVATMLRWGDDSGRKNFEDVVVFMPSSQVPINIVIQVVSYLKTIGKFQNVVLGSEVI